MTAATATPVSVAADAIAEQLTSHEGVLVGLDFDGTLAPISPSPETPTITPRNERALRALRARQNVHVAVVSGRALADLRRRVGIDDVVYAGNHGLELADDQGVHVHSTAQARQPAVRRARETVAATLDGVPGWHIEDKRLTATLHYRHVPDRYRPQVSAAVDLAGGNDTLVDVVHGKQSVELRPAIDWDKGALLGLLAARRPSTWVTVYVGDDTTDEDAFRALRSTDVGVFVGDGETAAAYRLPTQGDVAPFLEWVTALLSDGDGAAVERADADV